uniref:HDC02577 n=1 Tax=Drosophila melanogaster TaxID=7227 RepID=Q6IHH3_DROME|nr:TPA_inf: HDC02577 [Drosophila melanogaster]
MSKTNETCINGDIALEKEESLIDISSSSLEAQPNLSTSELETIVRNAVKQIPTPPNYVDVTVNSIANAILPKILNKYDTIEMKVENIQKSLDTYSRQAEAVDQDIAEIFLDLHTIYNRIEKLDKSGSKLCSAKKAILLRHVKKSEDLLNQSRHYLTNDPKELSAHLVGPPTEVPSIQKQHGNDIHLNRYKKYFMDAKRILNLDCN